MCIVTSSVKVVIMGCLLVSHIVLDALRALNHLSPQNPCTRDTIPLLYQCVTRTLERLRKLPKVTLLVES